MIRPAIRPIDGRNVLTRPHTSPHGDSARSNHPPEIPCFGPSPREVSRAVTALMSALPRDFRVGCVTDPSVSAAEYGSSTADFLPIPGHVVLSAPSWDSRSWRAALADCDLVFTLGRPKPDVPGILVLPEGELFLGDIRNTQADNPPGAGSALLACIAPPPVPESLPGGVPVFTPKRLKALADLILNRARAASAPLYGLVLTGGRSVRMRVDKASLIYHGKPQAEHCLDLLSAHCEKSFLSCRQDQSGLAGFSGFPQVHDTFLDMGPLGGILSALRAHRNAAFLVVACDLPFLDVATLAALVAGRDPIRAATAFAGPQEGLPEPLCAIYEPGGYPRMLQLMGQGVGCPRKFLLNSSSLILPAPDFRPLVNANDPEAYEAIRKSLTP